MSVTMPRACADPRSASLVTVAGLMSTHTSGTDVERLTVDDPSIREGASAPLARIRVTFTAAPAYVVGDVLHIIDVPDPALRPVPPREEIIDTVAALTLEHDGEPVKITTSVGVATTVPRDPELRAARELISASDVALYSAKHEGRNCWRAHPELPAVPA